MMTNTRIAKQRDILKKLAQEKKLSHAYLFSGNDNAQKEELLRYFVDVLGVQRADQIAVYPSENGSASEITIAQIRSLSSFLRMSAWSSPYTVAFLYHAHRMNQEAQSAFLKLLEEPKGDSIFFLLSEYPELLLDTIRSRAQEFKFFSFARESDAGSAKEFEKLRKSDLTVRFAAAKTLAESKDDIAEKLERWLVTARHLFIKAIGSDPEETSTLLETIKALQEVSLTLQTSNANPRLALERLMLDM